MSKSHSSNQTNQQHSPENDEKLKSRLPGELVEAIAPGELVSFNDANCEHKMLTRDVSVTETNTFFCANPNCNEVFIYDKL